MSVAIAPPTNDTMSADSTGVKRSQMSPLMRAGNTGSNPAAL